MVYAFFGHFGAHRALFLLFSQTSPSEFTKMITSPLSPRCRCAQSRGWDRESADWSRSSSAHLSFELQCLTSLRPASCQPGIDLCGQYIENLSSLQPTLDWLISFWLICNIKLGISPFCVIKCSLLSHPWAGRVQTSRRLILNLRRFFLDNFSYYKKRKIEAPVRVWSEKK